MTRNVLGVGDIHSNNVGLFIQDGWSPTSRLTINAGIRTESERIPFYTPGEENDGIKFGFGDKIAPRLGFAYDIKGDGKWKTYGSFGRYYDITKLEMPRGSLGGEQWHIYNYTLDTLNWKSVNCQEADPSCPGKLLEVITNRFGSNEPDNPETAGVMTKYFGAKRNLLQDNMKPMTSQEFTFGMDHELTRSMSAGIRYQHKNVLHAIEDFGWNEGGTEFYFIGNPGEGYIGGLNVLWGQTNPATGFTPAPLYNPANTGGKVFPQVKPVRDYDSVELRLTKRLSNRWSAEAIYQWSRLYGNYPGLASSDEAGNGTARLSPNVNRLYDGPMMDDTHKPALGLNTDRLLLQGAADVRLPVGHQRRRHVVHPLGCALFEGHKLPGLPADVLRRPRLARSLTRRAGARSARAARLQAGGPYPAERQPEHLEPVRQRRGDIHLDHAVPRQDHAVAR